MEYLPRPKGIIIHHSATRDTESLSYDAIRRYHIGEKRWDEIGYHYLIEDYQGEVRLFTGRGLQYMGAHCVGKNDYIGLCVVGNYDQVRPDNVYLSTLARTIVSLLLLYPELSVEDIHYHREFADKSCPGEKFPTLGELRFFVGEIRYGLNRYR